MKITNMKFPILLCFLTSAIAYALPVDDHGGIQRTTVSIVGDDFYINGQPTYAGRVWNGHRIEGLLMNSRMVQATFDDLNPDTVKRWAYADTGKWDTERNVNEFIAAMPEWKKHGLLAVTVYFQGGSPEGYSQTQPWITGAFTEDGSLRPDFTARMKRVLDAADANGMVVILGYFYIGQERHLRDEAAVIRATDEATRWLLDGGWRNVLVEVDNETTTAYHHEILRPARVHELIERVRKTEREGRHLLVGTSYGGGFVPRENVVRASDFLLLHGNEITNSVRITKMIQDTRLVPGYRSMPILINEDDHENFDQPQNNCAAAVAEHVSWGWLDFRRPGEALEQGYQSPPVNWGISSARKRAFFEYLGEITGFQVPSANSPHWQAAQPTNSNTLAAPLPKLKVSDNHRFLVTETGQPFFWLGDTAWELFHRSSRADADHYLEDRARKGFTVIQAVALAEMDDLKGGNFYGHRALCDKDPTKPDVKDGPDNDFWDHVDYVVAKANSLGLYIAFLPTWGDKWNKNGEWDRRFSPPPTPKLMAAGWGRATAMPEWCGFSAAIA